MGGSFFKIIGQLGALFTFRKAFSLCCWWLHPQGPHGMLVVSPLKKWVLGTTSVCMCRDGVCRAQTGVPCPHRYPPDEPTPQTGSHTYKTQPSTATPLVSCPPPRVHVVQGGQTDAASLPVAASSSTTSPFHIPTSHRRFLVET